MPFIALDLFQIVSYSNKRGCIQSRTNEKVNMKALLVAFMMISVAVSAADVTITIQANDSKIDQITWDNERAETNNEIRTTTGPHTVRWTVYGSGMGGQFEIYREQQVVLNKYSRVVIVKRDGTAPVCEFDDPILCDIHHPE